MPITQKYKITHAIRLNDGKIELQAEVLCVACKNGDDEIFVPTSKFLVDAGEIVRFNEVELYCPCGNRFYPHIPQKRGIEFLQEVQRQFPNCDTVFGVGTLQHEITHFFAGDGQFVPVNREALECFREETHKANGLRKHKNSDSVGGRKKNKFKPLSFMADDFESK